MCLHLVLQRNPLRRLNVELLLQYTDVGPELVSNTLRPPAILSSPERQLVALSPENAQVAAKRLRVPLDSAELALQARDRAHDVLAFPRHAPLFLLRARKLGRSLHERLLQVLDLVHLDVELVAARVVPGLRSLQSLAEGLDTLERTPISTRQPN